MKRILPFIIILFVLAIALASAWYFTRTIPASTPIASSQSNPTPRSSAAPTQVIPSQASPVQGVAGAEPAHTLGPPNAPAHLEEFGDFQCPPCGAFHPILQQMHAEFGDQLRITFREFPLVPAHPHALLAASAAEAAGLQGKFWEMHDVIYEHQKDWKDLLDVRPVFEGYAKNIGINIDRYKRDLESEYVSQRIFLDGKRGHSLGVKGTPTVFLNNREVPFESLGADTLRVVIQNELKASGTR